MNFLKGIWDWAFHVGYGELSTLIKFQNIAGKFHLAVYVTVYLMEILFMLALNHFVKKNGIGKGYHVLIVLLSFLPVVNCFLFFILKRKLNKQLFAYSGVSVRWSDGKLIAVWILMIVFVIMAILIPVMIFYLSSPELVSKTAYYMRYSTLAVDGYFLTTSLIYFFYYLEFKRMLNKVDLLKSGISDNQLLDDRVVVTKF
jgi:hypothetical protein